MVGCRSSTAGHDRLAARLARTPLPVSPVIGRRSALLEDRVDSQTNVVDDEKLHPEALVAGRRGWRRVPLRLPGAPPFWPAPDRRGWHTPLPVNPRRSAAHAAFGDVGMHVVHRLGGARRGVPAAPARVCPADGGTSPSRPSPDRGSATGSSTPSSQRPDPTGRSPGLTTRSTTAARHGRRPGQGRRCWCRPIRRPACARSTSRGSSPGPRACERQQGHLGRAAQPQREAGGAEAGRDVEVPAILDHVAGKVPLAELRR